MQRSTSIFSDFSSYKQYFLKIALQVMNIFYFSAGILLIILGTIMQNKYKEWSFFTKDISGVVPMIIVFSGVSIIIVSFVGCCGSVKESPCILLAYCSFLIIVFNLKMVTAVTAFSKIELIEDKIVSTVVSAIKNYNYLESSSMAGMPANETSKDNNKGLPLDHLQSTQFCCGAYNYTDWSNSTFIRGRFWEGHVSEFKNSLTGPQQINVIDKEDIFDFDNIDIQQIFVPDTCCNATEPTKLCGMNTNPKNIYQTGCIEILQKLMTKNVKILSWASIAVAATEIIGVVLSCLLFAETKKTPYDVVAAMQASEKSYDRRGWG